MATPCIGQPPPVSGLCLPQHDLHLPPRAHIRGVGTRPWPLVSTREVAGRSRAIVGNYVKSDSDQIGTWSRFES